MQEIIVEPSSVNHKRVFEELVAWEQEFWNKDHLLRQKSQDLNRSLLTNRILQTSLEQTRKIIDELNENVGEAEARAKELEEQSVEEKKVCERVVQKLTTKVDEMKRKYNADIDQYDQLLRTKTEDLKRGHHEFVKELTEKHKETIIALQMRIQEADKNKEDLTKENEELKNRMETLEKDTVPKEKHEYLMKEQQQEIGEVESQVKFLKSQYQTQSSEFSRLKQDNEAMHTALKKQRERMERVQGKVNEYEKTVNDLQQHIQQNSMRYQQALSQCQTLQTAREDLQREIANLKRKETHQLPRSEYRDEQVEALIKQNAILKALVKEMRNERIELLSKCRGEDSSSGFNETEERVDKMESAIADLKKVFVKKYLENCHVSLQNV